MKKLIVLLLLLLPVLGFGQAAKKELVMVKVIESNKGCFQTPLIHITEVNGTYRVIELEPHTSYKYLYIKENNKNQKIIHDTLEEYLNKGFNIVSHVESKYIECAMVDTFILVKPE